MDPTVCLGTEIICTYLCTQTHTLLDAPPHPRCKGKASFIEEVNRRHTLPIAFPTALVSPVPQELLGEKGGGGQWCWCKTRKLPESALLACMEVQTGVKTPTTAFQNFKAGM